MTLFGLDTHDETRLGIRENIKPNVGTVHSYIIGLCPPFNQK